MACAPDGTVYVANSNGRDVVAFNSAGTELGTMGSTDNLGFTRGIWVDSDGSVLGGHRCDRDRLPLRVVR